MRLLSAAVALAALALALPGRGVDDLTGGGGWGFSDTLPEVDDAFGTKNTVRAPLRGERDLASARLGELDEDVVDHLRDETEAFAEAIDAMRAKVGKRSAVNRGRRRGRDRVVRVRGAEPLRLSRQVAPDGAQAGLPGAR
jgi:hypothetical protein